MRPSAARLAPSRRSGALLLATLVAAVWLVIVFATGGLDWRIASVRLRSSDLLRPALATLLLAIAYAVAFRTRLEDDLAWLAALAARWSPALAGLASLAVLTAGLSYGTFVAGGADSYGYVSQSRLWLAGDLVVEQPLTRDLPWPNAAWTFAPLGYRPAATGAAIVPVYAPGLPMLMAVVTILAGDCGPFLVTPALGALAVWLTYVLGTRLFSRVTGLAAGILLAASPVFLMLLMSPMSDVPVTALWLATLVTTLGTSRLSKFWTGMLASLAILVRPNLAPLALAPLAHILLGSRGGRNRFRDTAFFLSGLLPGVLATAAIHTWLYGAPWTSGYGDFDSLFSWRYGLTNARWYLGWLAQSQTPLIFACGVPLAEAVRRRTTTLVAPAIMIAITWASYLFYLPHDHWETLRFVMPALPPMLVLAVAGWTLVASPLRQPHAALLLLTFTGVMALQLRYVWRQPTFEIRAAEARYVSVAAFVNARLPPNAVLVSEQHSGSLRHYTGRLTMRYDQLAPDWWPRALDVLQAHGYRAFVVLEGVENTQFVARFGAGDRDPRGSIIAELREAGPTRIYDPLRDEHDDLAPERIDLLTKRVCGRADLPPLARGH